MIRENYTRTLLCALLLAAGLLVCGTSSAEEECPEEELDPEVKTVLTHMEEASEGLEDLEARVTYERSIPLLEEKQKSRGTLKFKKEDLIALELGKPRNEAVYANGEKWWVVSHEAKEVEVYEASDEASREAAFLNFGYGEGYEPLLKDYQVELTGKEEKKKDDETIVFYRLRFTPRPRKDEDQPPPRYAAVEVGVSSERWLPHELALHESGGEILHTYTLSKMKLNTGIKDKVFDYDPPGGYTVWHPQQQD